MAGITATGSANTPPTTAAVRPQLPGAKNREAQAGSAAVASGQVRADNLTDFVDMVSETQAERLQYNEKEAELKKAQKLSLGGYGVSAVAAGIIFAMRRNVVAAAIASIVANCALLVGMANDRRLG